MRGGQRVGAGRPPGSGRKVVGIDGHPRPVTKPSVPVVEVEGHPLLIPPEDLTERRQRLWTAWAPLAIREATLIPSRVLGFRQLVTQLDFLEQLDKQVEVLGLGTSDGRQALANYIKLAQRVDSTMARYRLTSSGKSEAPPKPKASSNPWGAIASGAAR